jgi:hypothetical protein
LSDSGERRAEGCDGEDDFLSFIQSMLPINKYGVWRLFFVCFIACCFFSSSAVFYRWWTED